MSALHKIQLRGIDTNPCMHISLLSITLFDIIITELLSFISQELFNSADMVMLTYI